MAGTAGHQLRQKKIPSRLLRNFPRGGPTPERATLRGRRKSHHGQHRRLFGSLNARYGRDADIYQSYACQERALTLNPPCVHIFLTFLGRSRASPASFGDSTVLRAAIATSLMAVAPQTVASLAFRPGSCPDRESTHFLSPGVADALKTLCVLSCSS